MRTPIHGLALLVLTAACSDHPTTHSMSVGGSLGSDEPPASGGSAMSTGGTTGGQPGGGTAPDPATTGGAPGGGSGPQPLSFAVDIWPVISTVRDPVFVYYDGSTYESCVTTGVCHGGENPGAGLRMPDPETAYGMLFDVPSRSGLCNGTTRVVAGDPDQSCFILFYEGRLRDELDWVDTAEIDLMRRWISEGALP